MVGRSSVVVLLTSRIDQDLGVGLTASPDVCVSTPDYTCRVVACTLVLIQSQIAQPRRPTTGANSECGIRCLNQDIVLRRHMLALAMKDIGACGDNWGVFR